MGKIGGAVESCKSNKGKTDNDERKYLVAGVVSTTAGVA
jgi:hypothetical protein